MRTRASKTTGNRKSGSRWRPYLEALEARRLLAVWADFNNDGYGDLAVGVVGEEVNGVTHAGAVNVIYGTASGLASAGNEIWHLDSPGLLGDPTAYDFFGAELASGDFDADGYDDLAIGAPDADISGLPSSGAVWTLYGTAGGLTATGSERLHQDNPRVRDSAEFGDRFGASLAAADFDNDGYTDLAVGIPGEDIFAVNAAGAVQIFYGLHVGLSAPGNIIIHQDSPFVPGVAQTDDEFGVTLATGDINGDGRADLVVGVPSEEIDGDINAGQMHILFGAVNGITTNGSEFWYHSAHEPGDRYGHALAVGDFNDDGYDDVITGSPGEDIGDIVDAGMITIGYGSAGGLTEAGSTNWSQADLGGSTNEAGDQFGFSFAVGDFGGDGDDDLAIGTPYEDVGAIVDAGSISVFYAPFGMVGSQYFTQGASIGNGTLSESDDWFGYSLSAGNFDGDGFGDLAISTPLKDIGAFVNAGVVNVLYGQAGGGGGLSATGSQLWHQDSPGIQGVAETGDVFGGAVGGGSKSNPGGGSDDDNPMVPQPTLRREGTLVSRSPEARRRLGSEPALEMELQILP